jgi:GMP synthase-like glutamine amidotransferase
MILLVDMEHPLQIRRGAPCAQTGKDPRAARATYVQDVRRRLEACSGARCVTLPYWDVNQPWLASEGPAAVILSGNVADWDDYDGAKLEPLKEIVRSASLPILGLCGGLQFIALAHGVDVGPIRRLEEGEADVGAEFGGGYLKEWGYTAVDVLADEDPIFDGLTGGGRRPVFLEAHYCEAKAVPEGFELLASTPTSRIQALRRSGTMVYGTQFHPEAYIVEPGDAENCLIRHVYPDGYDGRQPDGRRFLVNFFRAAGIRR